MNIHGHQLVTWGKSILWVPAPSPAAASQAVFAGMKGSEELWRFR